MYEQKLSLAWPYLVAYPKAFPYWLVVKTEACVDETMWGQSFLGHPFMHTYISYAYMLGIMLK